MHKYLTFQDSFISVFVSRESEDPAEKGQEKVKMAFWFTSASQSSLPVVHPYPDPCLTSSARGGAGVTNNNVSPE
jgi:hypothetical protein